MWCPKSTAGAYLGGWHGFDVNEGHVVSLWSGSHQAVLGGISSALVDDVILTVGWYWDVLLPESVLGLVFHASQGMRVA